MSVFTKVEDFAVKMLSLTEKFDWPVAIKLSIRRSLRMVTCQSNFSIGVRMRGKFVES